MKSALKLTFCILVVCTTVAQATTIVVLRDGTGDYIVLQQALDVAAAGDTILVGPGEYLESTLVQFPGGDHEREVYAYVQVGELTLIGAGANETIIGPGVNSGCSSLESPIALAQVASGALRVSGIGFRNCHYGVLAQGPIFMEQCSVVNNCHGAILIMGSGGSSIRRTRFATSVVSASFAIRIYCPTGSSNFAIEESSFDGAEVLIENAGNVSFRGCDFSNYTCGLEIWNCDQVSVDACRMTNIEYTSIVMAYGEESVCEIHGSELTGGVSAVEQLQYRGRIIADGCRIVGGSRTAVHLSGWTGNCVVRNSDLVRGSGSIIECEIGFPYVVHDFQNNYWGTTLAGMIQQWIIDTNDDPEIASMVLYVPFVSQSVPAELTTWGELKASFR